MIVVYEWRNPRGWSQQSVHSDCDLTQEIAADLLKHQFRYASNGTSFRVTKEIDHLCDYLAVREFRFQVTQRGDTKILEAA